MRSGFLKTAVLSLPRESAFRSGPPPFSEEKTADLLSPVCEAVFRRLRCTSCQSAPSHRRFFLPRLPELPRLVSRARSSHQVTEVSCDPLPPLESQPRHMKLAVRLMPSDARFEPSSRSSRSLLEPSAHTEVLAGEAPVVNPQSRPRSGMPRSPLQMASHLLQTGPAFQGPSPRHTLRCQRLYSALPQKSSRLQGFAPLTSP
jgi:hypothetical protein